MNSLETVTFTHTGWMGVCPVYVAEDGETHYARHNLHGFLRFNKLIAQPFLDMTAMLMQRELEIKPSGLRELPTPFIVDFY